MHRIFVKFIEMHCGFSFATSCQYFLSPLTFTRLHIVLKIYVHFIKVSCVQCLVGKNITNQIMNELSMFVYIWLLIFWTSLVSSVVLDVACLRYIQLSGMNLYHISSSLV